MNFDSQHYVPILLAKRGERSAVRDLDAGSKAALTPMFVVAPVDWNFDTDAPAKSIDSHLGALPRDLSECWGTREAFVDLLFLDEAATMQSGQHALVWLTAEAAKHNLPLVPVTSPGRSHMYQQAVADVHGRDGRGVCLRLAPADWPSATGMAEIDSLLGAIGVRPNEVDLVLDLGSDVVTAPGLALAATRTEIAVLPHVHNWRTLTVAGAGMPKGMGDLPRGLNEVDRCEWLLYQGLVRGPALARVPTFGDYVIAHPDPTVGIDPKFMMISAALRYTDGDVWLVPKGELYKARAGRGFGGAAVPPIADVVVQDHRFMGIQHCTGDQWIHDAANNNNAGGSPETWRRQGTVHHLTAVTGQIATLFGS